MEYHITLPASWEICMQVKKQQLEPDMEQWTGSCSGLVHWEDPEGWDGEGGGRGDQNGEHI